ncbi:MAG TPA: LCP family protein [Aggregatilineaceae bacterium]|nr:LCP family protein [Aggregatilineaceae bacterium]
MTSHSRSMAALAILLAAATGLVLAGQPSGPALVSAAVPAPTLQETVPTRTPAPTPTSTPTPTPTISPAPTYPIEGTYTPPAAPPPLPIPPHAAMIPVDNDAIENILLLGSDSADNYYRRTDVMILVSINKQAQTVAMWHIPRALWVYIPNYTMDLINTVYTRGASGEVPGGGLGLLQETFRYNFGIELNHYARVNFNGFTTLIEALGGLEMSVDCAIQDWRLKDPELDPSVEDNWEIYTLPVGVWRLKPDTALWYVRSRETTDDLDRGRRQMDVLRAMWRQMRQAGTLSQISALWPQVSAIVDTDMTLPDVLDLVPLATTLDLSHLARYGGEIGVHYERTFTPDNGREVLIPIREQLIPMLTDYLTPPTANRLGRGTVTIDVADASWYGIGLAQVAADRLAWDGFAARPLDGITDIRRDLTVIYDYTGQTKGNPLPILEQLLRVDPQQVIRQPDPNRTVDFRVEIGTQYHLCVYGGAEDEIVSRTPAPGSVLSEADLRVSACWMRFRAQVNVRSGPGTGFPVLDVVIPNDDLPVTGRNEDSTWWRVDDNGETGWVSGEITSAETVGDCSGMPVAEG